MKSFTEHSREDNLADHINDFLSFCCEHLGLKELPDIELINDKKMAMENRSFGGYNPSTMSIRVNIAERHRADIFRTLAHELVHYQQDLNDRLEENSGETGSDIENEANSLAGVIMRNYAQHNERLFEEKHGLYYNIHQKRKEGRRMRKPGQPGAPTEQDFINAAKTAKK